MDKDAARHRAVSAPRARQKRHLRHVVLNGDTLHDEKQRPWLVAAYWTKDPPHSIISIDLARFQPRLSILHSLPHFALIDAPQQLHHPHPTNCLLLRLGACVERLSPPGDRSCVSLRTARGGYCPRLTDRCAFSLLAVSQASILVRLRSRALDVRETASYLASWGRWQVCPREGFMDL